MKTRSRFASLLLALRTLRERSTKERGFEYEPTYSIIGTARQQPSRISTQPPCILGKTFGSCLGSDSATADCWLRFHGARLRETVERARGLRRHPAYDERARASSHGVAHHSDRTHRRSRGPARSLCPPCKCANGRGPFRSDVNRSSPLRV